MTTVQVMLGDRSYPIRIRPGSLVDLGEALSKEFEVERVIAITTRNVAEAHYGAMATGMARMHLDVDRIEVPDRDRAKTLRNAGRLYDALLDLEADRDTILAGLGGGAACDLAGFVASTYLRGVPLVLIPTTLLAQVDASVGGKTGLNHPKAKNLIGTFYQPRLVWIDPDLVATLSKRELRSGLAELVKVAAVWDEEFFSWLEENVDDVLRLERDVLTEAISRAVRMKAEMIGLGERGSGLRALLGFGQTLAQAIEDVAGPSRVRHGEGIAMGMIFAARLARDVGLGDSAAADRIATLLDRIGLPTRPADWEQQKDAYLRAIAVDKRVRGGRIDFVALCEIGRAEVVSLTTEEILRGMA